MKQLFILFLLFYTTDSLASGIASNTASAPCTNTTLETYSGNSNLAADWQPNEIQLRWYNNNTLMTVQEAANTCVYDSALTIPSTQPIRTGYTFAGWEIRPEMDFSTISVENYISGYGMGGSTTINGYCAYSVYNGPVGESTSLCKTSEFRDLQAQEWKEQFDVGWLYGMAKCSAKSGNNHNVSWSSNYKSDWTATYEELESATGEKNQCWCKATGFLPNNDDIIYGPSNNLLWVYGGETRMEGYSGFCNQLCAIRCAGMYSRTSVYFRSALISQ